jgi:hypothetical protein
MLSSAKRINDGVETIFVESNASRESEKIKCPCSSKIRGISRIYGSRSGFIVFIYMWITIFSICCQGLPPVIKIGL